MNARQKAKKLKQELEFYKRMMVPVRYVKESHNVETYCYKSVFYKDDSFDRDHSLKKAISCVKLGIPDDMVTIDIRDHLGFPNTSMITATIQVVNPNVQEGGSVI